MHRHSQTSFSETIKKNHVHPLKKDQLKTIFGNKIPRISDGDIFYQFPINNKKRVIGYLQNNVFYIIVHDFSHLCYIMS